VGTGPGNNLESAAEQARRIIHDNDVERLKQLLAEYPALLSWRSSSTDGGLLGLATSSYGDSFDASREQAFTRAACAELLIDRGAAVTPSIVDALIQSRARGLLRLFHGKGLLPHSLRFRAALGDLDAVRALLDESGVDLAAIDDAFMCACRFEHEGIALLLLERSIALEPTLGAHVDGGMGRLAFVTFLCAERALTFTDAAPAGPWQAYLMERFMRAVQEGDLPTFVDGLKREPWLLGESESGFQVGLVERAAVRDRGEFIAALLDLDPALVRRRPPPPSQAIEFALTYAHPHLVPILTRIWPLPDDLPHAAGMGRLSEVQRWFDENGAPQLGALDHHYPCSNRQARMHDDLHWGAPAPQHVIDSALAWSVINGHFEVADFLLEHGADINTNWSSHEPASILHELVFHANYAAMRFLIDRGIDMTIEDYRWHATASGWALYAAKDEQMARWLEDARQQREKSTR